MKRIPSLATVLVLGLTSCTRDTVLDELTATTITPAGGTAKSADGLVTLDVPANAVSQATQIIIETRRNELKPAAALSEVYAFGPDGLHFATPVRLDIARVTKARAVIAQLDGTRVIPAADSEVDRANGHVSAHVEHFSTWTAVETWDACQSKACGDACTLCDPSDATCTEPAGARACNRDGVCVLALSASLLCAGDRDAGPADEGPADRVVPAGGELACAPAALDLGAVSVGQTASAVVTCANTGTADLVVASVTVTGSSSFQVMAPVLPTSLPPGSAVAIPVAYAPVAVETASGSLVIESSAVSAPHVEVALTARGVTGPVLEEVEPNDTEATAQPTNVATPATSQRAELEIHGAIPTAGDEDFFGFELTTPANLTATTYTSQGQPASCAGGSSADTYLTLWSGGLAIAQNDDDGRGSCSSFSVTLAPGRYAVSVRAFDQARGTIPTYHLKLLLLGVAAPTDGGLPDALVDAGLPDVGPAVDGGSPDAGVATQVGETEPNDVQSSTSLFSFGASRSMYISGAIDPAGDVDVFGVIVPGGTLIATTYETAAPGGAGTCSSATDTVLEVRDGAGNSLATNDDSASMIGCSRIELPVTAGDYGVVVRAFDAQRGVIPHYVLVLEIP